MNTESETPQNQNTETGLDGDAAQTAYPDNIPQQAVCLDPDGNIRRWVDSQLNGNVIDIGQEPGYVSAVKTIEASLTEIGSKPYDPNKIISHKLWHGGCQAVWEKNIKPLLDLHFNGYWRGLGYGIGVTHRVDVTQELFLELQRKAVMCCYKGFNPIFEPPIDNSIYEVMRRLYAGQEVYTGNDLLGPVNLKEIFYHFLETITLDKTVPIFLTHLLMTLVSEGLGLYQTGEYHYEED